ncbi:MAG: 5'-nucleotidase C-terminal domain-containing protein, partial [Spirochaetales bacterium]|nr:5'-nucleotidase C-terminal domain-containing protein [Candidatus Physcosoma equi]
GVTTPDVPFWDGGNPEVVRCTFLPAQDAVKKEIELLKENTDCIIVSAHLGMEPEFPALGGGDSGIRLLEENPEVTLLQVGHCHITTSGTFGSTLYGGCINDGAEAVRFDLYFEGTRLLEKSVSIVKMKDYEPSPLVTTLPLVQKYHQKTVEFASGTGEANILGTTTERFQPKNTIKDVPEAYLRNTPLPDFINRVMMEATGADVSCAPLFKLTSDLPKGNIYYKDIFNIYKFANVLCRLRLSGKELKKWLEYNASFYRVDENGVSFSETFPYFAYDLFLGVDYTTDLSRPVGDRIRKATFRGTPLEEVESLTIAVAQYRYSSLIVGKGIAEATMEWQAPLSVRDYIVEHMAKHSPLNPEDYLGSNWSLIGYDKEQFSSKGLVTH